MKIGNAIKTCRMRAGLTQSQLAKKSKVSQGYIANIEKRNLIPSQKIYERICDTLEIPSVVLIIMATEYKDIKKNKKKIYAALKPVINVLVENILNDVYGKSSTD
jgi:transcriptional regulator with XRE-family HTH domain